MFGNLHQLELSFSPMIVTEQQIYMDSVELGLDSLLGDQRPQKQQDPTNHGV